jgi:hypothetical protein
VTALGDDPLDIPPALRRKRGDHAEKWAGRTATGFVAPPPAAFGGPREDDPATAAIRAELEAEKKLRAGNRIAKMRARLDNKKVDRTDQRWDARHNRWADTRPPTLPTLEELTMNINLEEKDFAVMGGPDLVRWYNAACEVASRHRMASYKPVKKFETKEKAVKRCAFLAHSLRAAARAAEEGREAPPPHCPKCGAVSGSCDHTQANANKELYKPEEVEKDLRPPFLVNKADGPPPAGAVELKPVGELNVAKKQAKRANKDTNGAASGYRIKGKPAKAVAEFKPVRAGTDRAVVLKMAAVKSTASLETIAKELKCEPKYIAVHLYSLNRDSGIGYEVDAAGGIELKFPGSKTVKDAIVQKAAEE